MLPLASVMLIATSAGQTFGVSVFNTYIRAELDLTHSQLTGGYLLASLLAALPMPLMGWLIDRYGLRAMGLTVVVMLGLACMAISQAHGLVTLTLGFWMLRTFGQGSLTLISSNTLAMWFSRRLGLVTGLFGVGMSLAVAILPTIYLALIHDLGWRLAYYTLGVTTCLVLLPLIVLFYRNRPEDVGQRVDGLPAGGPKRGNAVDNKTTAHADSEESAYSFDLWAAMRTRSFWAAMLASAMWGMIGTAIFFNIVPIFQWRGMTESQAAAVFGVFALAMGIMQLVGGALSDRIPLNYLLAGGYCGFTLGVSLLWMAPPEYVPLFAIPLGASQGLVASAGNTLWPRYFGSLHLGKIRSSVWTATVAGCSLGPFIMGFSIDYFGSYGPSLALFLGLLITTAVISLLATKPQPNQASPSPMIP